MENMGDMMGEIDENQSYEMLEKMFKAFIPMIELKDVKFTENTKFGYFKYLSLEKKFGFFTDELSGVDIFFHMDDLLKTGISYELAEYARKLKIKVVYEALSYVGKHKESVKAINVKLLTDS